jgi:FkbM family methyltransferase
MNIEVIAEHSVDIDLLPEKAKVLDLGCRGFLFTDELRRRGHNVLAIDIDKLDRDDYEQMAVSFKVGRVGIKRSRDPQATMIGEGSEVMCVDLPFLMHLTKVDLFSLIKMDIEGAEYDIIMALTKAPAKQLSIEFHLHTGIYGETEMLLMENKLLSLGYFPVKHDKTRQHGLSYNYWDSLFILK